ncbi:leucyl-tRNA synthetase [Saprolegnia diclina VS20]|uniref:leucine--tRNA ligase n=1 Tax=Saprolegnia diclina (strain VS20) TaxID=1156394 RepID=T0R3U4_SAPDV|nr:leucyl-tRNA synthetase [Saprolegnia diclina VS20]EQC26718.1 leucyl-tRNA synthetase [Saprolegnia diclina VS20]|eukprot:XP_008619842.1 leucyl-tRNA synthetase [Saprolegnia diclina VS20]
MASMLLRRARPLLASARHSFSTQRVTRLSQVVDKKWQAAWEAKHEAKALAPATSDKPKFYCLSMFPYPSGQLHMGHVRVYTISDTMARLRRMQGYDVLHPMGWDAFGLPAENAAIERGVSPADWTLSNIAEAKRQMKNLGIIFDWSQEVTTCQADYYKWTQWIFLEFLKKGLAYRKEAMVNWDPIDQTVLANEQVDAQGRSWRSGAIVEQRALSQWFLGITKYGDELLNGIDTLTEWPDAVKRMQAAWIGRSEGAQVHFNLPVVGDKQLTVFTTRVETLLGVSYVAVCPEHDLMDELRAHVPAPQRAAVDAFIARTKALTKDQRNNGDTSSGVNTGLTVVHPITKQEVPVYLAEYVLPGVGTGAVMGVPAHDDRDAVFAGHHGLAARRVLTDDNVLCDSGAFSGLSADVAKTAIIAHLQADNHGDAHVQYRLRDWLVSRQRYWGAPVPVIHCPSCGPVGVPAADLPVELPPLTNPEEDLRGKGGSPLARMGHWKHCRCPECGGPAERDTDTLDTFVDSSWYFLRYGDATNADAPFTQPQLTKWMTNGVDLYIGGIEHAILHLLYSRFVTRFLADTHNVPTSEPFKKLLAQGMVLGRTYKSPESLRFLKPHEITVDDDGTVREAATGEVVVTAWEKMSKSKYNGVDPEDIYRQYGADVARLLVLFKAPPAHELEWDEADLLGQSRWLMRIWGLLYDHLDATSSSSDSLESHAKEAKELSLAVHTAIQKVTNALEETQSFNVAIAELMKLSNKMGQVGHLAGSPAYDHAIRSLVTMLSPLAPHNASEMYATLHRTATDDVHDLPWPVHDPNVLASAEMHVVIQIRGKTRETMQVPADADEATLRALALALPNVQKHVGDSAGIRKVIFVPSRKQGQHALLNFVV